VQAEACFQQALAVARDQQAKSWELRATMSLSRLWQHQSKRTERQAGHTPEFDAFQASGGLVTPAKAISVPSMSMLW
jgi:hypothetical protein